MLKLSLWFLLMLLFRRGRGGVANGRTLQMSFSTSPRFTAYIALGSNLGDRCGALHLAVKALRRLGSLQATSFLYESLPMYVTDQPRFLNAVVQLGTELPPEQLLSELQAVEIEVGRTKSFRNGPRLLDLDVLFCTVASPGASQFSSLVVDTPALQLPHPRIHERAFVLEPLFDLNPSLLIPLPGGKGYKTTRQLLAELPWAERNALRRVLPFGYHGPSDERLTRLAPLASSGCSGDRASSQDSLVHRPRDCPVLVQGILNLTPDSFSDGGAFGGSVDAAVQAALTMLREGADIIDVGGESTRPMAIPVPPEEEQRRILPVISQLAETCSALGLPLAISVDTRNADTARLALQAGASIINDVSAGRHDKRMIQLAAEHCVPLVMMHSRGTPQTMDSVPHTAYDNLIHDVCGELEERLATADEAGLPRWLQVVDPGLGFAKTAEQNRQLLQPDSMSLINSRLGARPILIGASRKRFLASASTPNAAPKDRDDATSGVNALAIVGGATILRVHNVAAARRVADAVHSVLSAAKE